MLSETMQLKVVDTTQTSDILKVVPREPILSSQSLNWDGVCFQYHHQPAWETPYFSNIHHLIIIHHSQYIQAESLLGSKKRHQQIVKGDIVIAPANTPNLHVWDRDMEFSSLLLKPTHIAQIAYESIKDMERFEILPYFSTPDPLIYQFCQALKSELELGESCNHFYVDHMISALSIHLIRNYSIQKPLIRSYSDGLSKHKLQRAIAYIKEHMTENLSLKEMSALVEMSPHYFTSLFKLSTGMSAYQYLIHCRMEKAKFLLCKQDLSIAEISQQLGFQNPCYFTNAFRKYTSVTPTKYRKEKQSIKTSYSGKDFNQQLSKGKR
jgi:AraC family transcriptional regulator